MSDDLHGPVKDGLSMAQIKEIVAHLAKTYSDYMEAWMGEEEETSSKAVASAYSLAAFDLINLLHMLDGDFQAVADNQKESGSAGSFKLEEVAEWPPINAPGDDPDADPGDPTRWN